MIYLGPTKKIKGKKFIDGKIVYSEYEARTLYTETYNEIMNTLHKLGRPVKYIKRHYNYFSYVLSKGYAWQLVRLRDQNFVKFEELTLMGEQEFIERKNEEHRMQKAGL
jgi:hypothetical protein